VQVGESGVHGHAYDTKHPALSRVNTSPYELKAQRDESLKARNIRESLLESRFALPAEGLEGESEVRSG